MNNEQIIRRAYELAEKVDVKGWVECFTPDGTRLIYVTNGKEGGIHVWDLRAIRRGLKAMDLDWDTPEYPPESPADSTPLRLEIVP